MKTDKILYYETGSFDPAYNLAFEEYVHRNKTESPVLILWQNDRAVIIGQNQNAEREVDISLAKKMNIKTVRRPTGGGAVYHDLGNLNYSFIDNAESADKDTYLAFTKPVADALNALGLDAAVTGRNDITIGERKISGTAQKLLGDRLLLHGTLLFDSDLDMIGNVLKPDPLKLQSKSTKSVRARVGNIRPLLKKDMTLPEFKEHLKTFLGGDRLLPAVLTEEELEKVSALKTEKYDTWEWNYGRAPEFSLTNRKKWSGGILETGINIKEGIIEDIVISGDFLSLMPVDPVRELLCGCRFNKEEVLKKLKSIKTENYFGSITPEEAVDTIFDTGTETEK